MPPSAPAGEALEDPRAVVVADPRSAVAHACEDRHAGRCNVSHHREIAARFATFGRRLGGEPKLATAGAPGLALQPSAAADDREHSLSGRK
jgi:hypothetical protein